MKKVLSIIAVIVFVAGLSFAQEVELSPYALFPTGEDVSQGYGAELKVLPFSGEIIKRIYGYGSYDLNPVQFDGHDMGIVNLASLGLGYTKRWTKGKHGFKVSADGGYYNPHNSDLERTEISSSQRLVGYKYSRCKKAPVYCTDYTVSDTKLEYSGAFGGKLIVGYAYQIKDSVSIDFGGGYRYLELDREVNGVADKQDFSAWLGMVSFNIKF